MKTFIVVENLSGFLLSGSGVVSLVHPASGRASEYSLADAATALAAYRATDNAADLSIVPRSLFAGSCSGSPYIYGSTMTADEKRADARRTARAAKSGRRI